MPEAPPTLPGPLQRPARPRGGRILLGMGVCVAWVFVACVATPLAMGSNIWPIAAGFWMVLTVPIAAGVGALAGWMLTGRRPQIAVPILILTGILLAVATAIIMWVSD